MSVHLSTRRALQRLTTAKLRTPASCRRHSSTSNPTNQRQSRIPASYYRGGTSRGLIFHADHLPANRADWAPIFRGTLGSPDPHGRQLDGLGGGISSLSKICVVGPSKRKDAQVDFTFVQVGIKDGEVDYSGNCGNLMSAIGPYAVDTRVVDIDEDGPHPTLADNEPVTIRIYNTNTDKLIDATFPVSEGEAAVAYGDFAIDGVAGTGAKIKLDFLDPAGSKTGKMLPTGNAVDVFDGIRTTCIDVGNPCIMVLASKLGIDGTILPDETSQDTALLSRLERIRVQAAIKTGMATTPEDVPASIPKVCFVSPPSRHRLVSGRMQEEDEVDIVARAISVGQPHKALPITAGLSMCAAAGVEGSVVQTCLLSSGSSTLSPTGELMIGHASGRLDVGATFVDAKGGGKLLERVTVFRTARRLMDGVVYWK